MFKKLAGSILSVILSASILITPVGVFAENVSDDVIPTVEQFVVETPEIDAADKNPGTTPRPIPGASGELGALAETITPAMKATAEAAYEALLDAPVELFDWTNRGIIESTRMNSTTEFEYIARLAREELERMDPAEETPLRLTDRVTAKTVFDAYKTGDKASIRIVERFAKYLGTTLSVFACVVDPEVIVLGGGVSKAGQVLVDVVENYFLKTAFPACRETKIVLAELGNDAGIYGSARLVLG
jgi:glucokinase